MTIRTLVVDDSALMRHTLARLLDADAEIEVVGAAYNGLDALVQVERLQPDVVTMDVNMPGMDGLAALELLMRRFPVPVVMLSSLTEAGTEATVRALALGAVDFVAKPTHLTGLGMSSIADELVEKVRRAAGARVGRTPISAPSSRSSAMPPANGRHPPVDLIVVGASTGGPRAIAEVLAGLPANLPCPVIVVQHLPAGFTQSLGRRLNEICPLDVAEAHAGQRLRPGLVLLAPGDFHLTLQGSRVLLDQGPRRHGVRPSIDTTLESVARGFHGIALAIILTGMGDDGMQGSRALKATGGMVWAEDESTCVIYGMPRAVIEAGLADAVLPVNQIARGIVTHLGGGADAITSTAHR